MKFFKLIWSKKAANDLRKIKEFISCDKAGAAVKWVKRIKSKTERLKKFPYSGRIVPELSRKDIREIVDGNYRVIYKVALKEMYVLTVFETHQQFPLTKNESRTKN